MAETYTSGTWIVKPGEEEAFVREWTAFVAWGSTMPGSGTFRLVRDLERPGAYLSFAPWESFEMQRDWKQTEEFAVRMKRVQEHVDGFEPATFELVVEVG